VIAALVPNAHVVKAFNTLFASVFPDGSVGGKPLDVFIAGDDQRSKETVTELVNTSGMRTIDAGSLSNARHLEGIELIHMITQDQIKGNYRTAIKFLK
jgi:predicted dinucleotide-binding enzyme